MSIYASIEGIGDVGDPEHLGQPWVYRGSHLTPADTDPRAGSIGLAVIPSHITADGRDDQPCDGPPWPFLRLHLDVPGDDPCALIDPAQARYLAEQLTAWADRAEPGTHHYLSTGCLHGRHDYCSNVDGIAGLKKPAQCKFCTAPCRCDCHQERP